MKVSAILKGSKDQYGRQKVIIRVADKFQRRFHPTNIRLLPKDFIKGIVQPSHPQHKQLNASIKASILAYESGILFGKPAKVDKDFYAYCLESFSAWEKVKTFSTIRQHWAEVSKMKGYSSGVKLSQINQEWLQGYSDYCYSLGNQTNTVHKTFKFLRMILRKAHRERLIEVNPFDLFKMPVYRDPQRTFLTREQVMKIDKFVFDKKCPKELQFIGAWFLISCWTGLRFGDCAAFNKTKIRDGRLIVYTKKTHDVISIPFSAKLKNLFTLIDYRPLDLTNEYCNRMIKVIAEAAGIEEHISFHIARHTAATMMASAGIRQEVIARVLGHADLRSTAIYMRLTAPTIDKELAKMK